MASITHITFEVPVSGADDVTLEPLSDTVDRYSMSKSRTSWYHVMPVEFLGIGVMSKLARHSNLPFDNVQFLKKIVSMGA